MRATSRTVRFGWSRRHEARPPGLHIESRHSRLESHAISEVRRRPGRNRRNAAATAVIDLGSEKRDEQIGEIESVQLFDEMPHHSPSPWRMIRTFSVVIRPLFVNSMISEMNALIFCSASTISITMGRSCDSRRIFAV
jgi:hypothetical protein